MAMSMIIGVSGMIDLLTWHWLIGELTMLRLFHFLLDTPSALGIM